MNSIEPVRLASIQLASGLAEDLRALNVKLVSAPLPLDFNARSPLSHGAPFFLTEAMEDLKTLLNFGQRVLQGIPIRRSPPGYREMLVEPIQDRIQMAASKTMSARELEALTVSPVYTPSGEGFLKGLLSSYSVNQFASTKFNDGIIIRENTVNPSHQSEGAVPHNLTTNQQAPKHFQPELISRTASPHDTLSARQHPYERLRPPRRETPKQPSGSISSFFAKFKQILSKFLRGLNKAPIAPIS